MLNIKSQLFVAAALVAGSFGFSSSAFAGEGGVAGAASFQLTGGAVTQASVAVAVGKSTAYAGAATPGGIGTEAFAAGTGGAMTFSGNSIYIQSIDTENANRLGTAQVNQLDGNDVNIDVINGTADITNTTVSPL
jgi:hypothetical protein